jgi:hypothetical protein
MATIILPGKVLKASLLPTNKGINQEVRRAKLERENAKIE